MVTHAQMRVHHGPTSRVSLHCSRRLPHARIWHTHICIEQQIMEMVTPHWPAGCRQQSSSLVCCHPKPSQAIRQSERWKDSSNQLLHVQTGQIKMKQVYCIKEYIQIRTGMLTQRSTAFLSAIGWATSVGTCIQFGLATFLAGWLFTAISSLGSLVLVQVTADSFGFIVGFQRSIDHCGQLVWLLLFHFGHDDRLFVSCSPKVESSWKRWKLLVEPTEDSDESQCSEWTECSAFICLPGHPSTPPSW